MATSGNRGNVRTYRNLGLDPTDRTGREIIVPPMVREGPQGEQGPTGPQGPAGRAGLPNVVLSTEDTIADQISGIADGDLVFLPSGSYSLGDCTWNKDNVTLYGASDTYVDLDTDDARLHVTGVRNRFIGLQFRTAKPSVPAYADVILAAGVGNKFDQCQFSHVSGYRPNYDIRITAKGCTVDGCVFSSSWIDGALSFRYGSAVFVDGVAGSADAPTQIRSCHLTAPLPASAEWLSGITIYEGSTHVDVDMCRIDLAAALTGNVIGVAFPASGAWSAISKISKTEIIGPSTANSFGILGFNASYVDVSDCRTSGLAHGIYLHDGSWWTAIGGRYGGGTATSGAFMTIDGAASHVVGSASHIDVASGACGIYTAGTDSPSYLSFDCLVLKGNGGLSRGYRGACTVAPLEVSFTGCHFHDLDYGVLLGAANWNVSVTGCRMRNCTNGIYATAAAVASSCFDVFAGNAVDGTGAGGSYGIFIGDNLTDFVVASNMCCSGWGGVASFGISVSAVATDNYTVVGNATQTRSIPVNAATKVNIGNVA